ncbi:MAG: hypothetical protein K0R48_1103 [Gammaproteobacteria bacterium]|nr:hypothetical protein [Gammaproteobacteria bacterium]
MLSIESIKEKFETSTTCEELCFLLSRLSIPARVKLLSDPNHQQKLLNLIKTTDDILELEKGPLNFKKDALLIAALFPIYNKASMSNIEKTVSVIQQNFSNVRLLAWLTYEERNVVLAAFLPRLRDTITNATLGSLLPYLDQEGQKLTLTKLEDKLETLVQTLEDVKIFQNISFDAIPYSLSKIITKIFDREPLSKIADIINACECYKKDDIKIEPDLVKYIQNEAIFSVDSDFGVGDIFWNAIGTPSVLLQLLCYKNCSDKELFYVCALLSSAACTEIFRICLRGEFFVEGSPVSLLTGILIQNKRNDLFANLIIRFKCQQTVIERLKFLMEDLTKPKHEQECSADEGLELLFYSSFWFDSSQYKEISSPTRKVWYPGSDSYLYSP